MKAIALLTMTFLPGTFVAVGCQRPLQKNHHEANFCGLKSFFAMPLLNWQAPRGGPVVSHRLWIYWAVTAPLTAVVLLLWSTWYLLSGHQRTQHHLTQRKGSGNCHSKRERFGMHVFTVLGLDPMRRNSKRLPRNNTTEAMTDDTV